MWHPCLSNLLLEDYKNNINFKFIFKTVALTSLWQSIILKIHEKQLWKVILTLGCHISRTLHCFIEYSRESSMLFVNTSPDFTYSNLFFLDLEDGQCFLFLSAVFLKNKTKKLKKPIQTNRRKTILREDDTNYSHFLALYRWFLSLKM